MTVTGIIAEYNPFHNGHRYQINEAKKDADAIAVVMSGSFVQRGDVAIFDPWERAQMALNNGADLVVQLPVCFSLATAERFAFGAVCLMEALRVDKLCFGSESGDLEALKKAALLLEQEPEPVSQKIKEYLSSGLSYPAARAKAFTSYLEPGLLSQPNNLLAIEYLRILLRLQSPIVPQTVCRQGDGYHAAAVQSRFASATALRKLIAEQKDISSYTPTSLPRCSYDLSRLEAAVLSCLRFMQPDKLRTISDVSEGLEHRIVKGAKAAVSLQDLLKKVHTKRYPDSKLRRIFLCALLNIPSGMNQKPPSYLRILGFNKKGREILSRLKNNTTLPIITKTADHTGDAMFDLDLRSTDLAALCASDPAFRKGGKDFFHSPIVIP